MSIFCFSRPSRGYAHLPNTDMQIIPDTRAASAISTRDILACSSDPDVKSVERSSAAVYSCEAEGGEQDPTRKSGKCSLPRYQH